MITGSSNSPRLSLSLLSLTWAKPDLTSLVNKGFILWFKEQAVRNLERILSARVANHSVEFGSSWPLMEQNVQ